MLIEEMGKSVYETWVLLLKMLHDCVVKNVNRGRLELIKRRFLDDFGSGLLVLG